ncbi:EamA family transporter [Pseudomonas syringae]|uniref:Permease of the drug/metabolite transporter super family n=1 Tax=Pseudomonas syringae pv. coryli TaxID=317659 RepID=A0A0P9P8E5_9PSED|nr:MULTISPECIES: EamA family transporter [Pseudomonas syringae group]KPX08973.1 Permease of the drug/metabolite transporter super family [Pseudomonas syringae pv. coryli]MCL6308250.1 EamA family transporter [Pseudomonas syringae]
MKPLHIALAVLVMAIWGINFSVIKLGLTNVDPLILAGLRFSLCALPAIFFVRRPNVPWRYLIGYGLVFGIGLWGIVNLGIKAGLSAGIASLVLQFSAFFSILLGSWVFREALNRFQILGMLIALSGLLSVILISDGSVSLLGMLLVLVGALSMSVANIINKKANTRDVFAFLVWSSAFSPIPLFALDYAINGSVGYIMFANHIGTTAVLSILFQVYPNTLFAYWIWNSLLKTYPISTVAPLSLLVPIFGMLGSVVIFNEHMSTGKVLAVLLIVAGLGVGLYGRRIFDGLIGRDGRVLR